MSRALTPSERALLREAAARLCAEAGALRFSEPVHTVYNPLDYAGERWDEYVTRYAGSGLRALLMGMNPGPWGMAQTGVPFGEISAVRDWMALEGRVGRPEEEHPKRPIDGFACTRSEVSGRRLWNLMRERFGSAEDFFSTHFVTNYCPLVFMAASGRNITPDKLRASERDRLFQSCDTYLRTLVAALRPHIVVGVGKFAEGRATAALAGMDVLVGSILHPSPASPAANRDWAGTATNQLISLGVWSA